MQTKEVIKKWRKRIFEIVEVATPEDKASRAYDLLNMLTIVINLIVSLAYTFETVRLKYGRVLITLEMITVVFFAMDYLLRVATARFRYKQKSEIRAALKYALSASGIIDLLSFLPYWLPIFFPSGAVAFRMFRIIRIFRLFRINSYYDSLNVITEVITSKSQQIISSVFIIVVLMTASSLCMYSIEHDAQPHVFTNAFSGIWWAVSTLLTVGYGDIYPITDVGKLFSIVITFLGVGVVAIPTGIISAGFVDQYTRIKRISEYGDEEDIHFIKIHLEEGDRWIGHTLQQMGFPRGVIVAAIQRNERILVPRGSTKLMEGDVIVIGAEPYNNDQHIDLQEIVLGKQNPWVGEAIRDLDISRHTMIVMVKRRGRVLIPNGSMVLEEKDIVVLYSQKHIHHSHTIHV
ncbi:MAG: ion transporter [Clostridia bacterium]|nr:ion transporter [Clostridia bacterium]